ncbi:ariadne RING finger, putative [Entamoeba invadens IP1]|uniref:RBR-type E3 ubiquitin transferase n=1 Tax=Entamoeba invadens IP1 TaxID=370355 RepID=A0A0A1U8R5_ENTIV|nr:ariadne RING finger, putative [Entamoeba invadens IP1]ELP91237.1 ariadne RING finger, putative [Entamoeba invadens IP1]|eukprot:XP_004258008.1 ariadne RING finger, putative [Entamoeba invadens IP1]
MYSIYSLDIEEFLLQPNEKRLFILEECVKSYRARQEHEKMLTFNCSVCMEDVPFDDTYINVCGHRFCKSCVRDSIKYQMKQTWEKVHCQEGGCFQVIDISDILLYNLIEDKALLQNYTERLDKKTFETSIKLCPKCHKELFLVCDKGMAACVYCEYTFCRECLEPWHVGRTCEQWKEFIKNEDENKERMVQWIKQNTKICPRCKNPIQKNGGCNHMTCRCGHQFCWLCMADYNSNHWSTNTTGCRQFTN